MKATYPTLPSERDQTIYRLTVILSSSQAEVAEMFGMSQARVSQICARVRKWVTLVSGNEGNIEQEIFLAARETRVRLEENLVRANSVFEDSRQTFEQTKTVRRDLSLTNIERIETTTRPGRANAAMFRQIVRLQEDIFTATERECVLKGQMLQKKSQSRWWRDEEQVQRCLDLCRQMVMQEAQLRRDGIAPLRRPLFNMEQLTTAIRQRVAACALDAPARDLTYYLPAEWQLFAQELGVMETLEERAEEAPSEDIAAPQTAATAETESVPRAEEMDIPPVEELLAESPTALATVKERSNTVVDVSDNDAVSVTSGATLANIADEADIAYIANIANSTACCEARDGDEQPAVGECSPATEIARRGRNMGRSSERAPIRRPHAPSDVLDLYLPQAFQACGTGTPAFRHALSDACREHFTESDEY